MFNKRYILYISIILILIVITGCGYASPSENTNGHTNSYINGNANSVDYVNNTVTDFDNSVRMVIIDGETYYDTNRESDIVGRCGVMDGKIKEEQSNFGGDYEYQFVDSKSIDIVIDGKWIRFEKTSDYPWGIKLTAANVSNTGLTIICNHISDDRTSEQLSVQQQTGELLTGEPYILEELVDGSWEPVKIIIETEYGWHDIALIVKLNGTTSWDINWKWLYGELPIGNYRIGKEFIYINSTDNIDTKTFYAYFEI